MNTKGHCYPKVYHSAPFGCGDLDGTNFYKFYRRFKEIAILRVMPVFHLRYELGLDVLLEIGVKFVVNFKFCDIGFLNSNLSSVAFAFTAFLILLHPNMPRFCHKTF